MRAREREREVLHTGDVFDEVGVDGFIRGNGSCHQHRHLHTKETYGQCMAFIAYVLNVCQSGGEGRPAREHSVHRLYPQSLLGRHI